MTPWRWTCALFLALLPWTAAAVAEEKTDPAAPLRKLHAAMKAQAKAHPKLSVAQHAERLLPVIRETHDGDLAAGRLVGTPWTKLKKAESTKLADLVLRLLAVAHARDIAAGRMQYTYREPMEWRKGLWLVPVQRVDRSLDVATLSYIVAEPRKGEIRIVDRALFDEKRGGNIPEILPTAEQAGALWKKGGAGALVKTLESRLPEKPPAVPATASAVVAQLQDALIEAMKSGARLGFRGRFDKLDPVVKSAHHIPAIARLTVRRHWSKLSKDQQAQFVKIFSELSTSNYANKFKNWSGESFRRTGERKSGKSTIVSSILTKSNGERIRFDYTMRQVKGRWRILNITVDGVSDLSTKQAEYGGLMSSGGFPRLISRLREQIRKLARG